MCFYTMSVLLNCPCKNTNTSGFSDRFVVLTSLTVSGLFSLAGVFLEVKLYTYFAYRHHQNAHQYYHHQIHLWGVSENILQHRPYHHNPASLRKGAKKTIQSVRILIPRGVLFKHNTKPYKICFIAYITQLVYLPG